MPLRKVKSSIGVFLLFFLAFSCKDNEQTGTAVSGKLTIVADESFLSIINAEKKIFEYLYKDARISTFTSPESEAITKFVEGKADMAIVSRLLSENEKVALKKNNIPPDSYRIAYDGIAIIAHRERKDSTLSSIELKEILNGKILRWQDMEGKEGDQIVIAFDQKNSSNLLGVNKKFPINTSSIKVFAAGSNQKVIEYVQSHKEAIGFIGLSWLSGDPASNKHLKNIKVLSIDGYSPWQEDLATGKYPLKRDIILLNRYKGGLGTGFASFILSEDGQRIILKAGLLPVKMPGREVIFN